jgi:hypothetical protein
MINLKQKRYEINCLAEVFEELSKHFPDCEIDLMAGEGAYTIHIDFGELYGAIDLRNFEGTKCRLAARYGTNQFSETIDSFYIHSKVKEALEHVHGKRFGPNYI